MPKTIEQLVRESTKETTGKLEEKMGWISNIVIAIIVILVMGFVSLLGTTASLVWNAHMWGANTYQSLEKEIHNNNDKLNSLIENIGKVSTSSINSSSEPKK